MTVVTPPQAEFMTDAVAHRADTRFVRDKGLSQARRGPGLAPSLADSNYGECLFLMTA